MVSESRSSESQHPCAVCGCVTFRLLGPVPTTGREWGVQFQLEECVECHVVRSCPVLDDDQMASLYTPQYYGPKERRSVLTVERTRAILTRWRAQWLARYVDALTPRAAGVARRVLDIGCGRGALLLAFHAQGWECWGIERPEFPDPDTSEYTLLRSADEVTALPSASFDLVTLWHSLEHMNDPANTLAIAARLLKPGGVLALMVPHFASFQRRLFGGRWFAMDVPTHRYHYSKGSLSRLLGDAFRPVAVRTWALPDNTFIFVQSTINAIWRGQLPNALYRRLQLRQRTDASAVQLIAEAAIGAISVPFGLLENVVTPMLGCGATYTLVAQRTEQPPAA